MRWLLVFLVACGGAVPPLPSQGGPAWIELESEHFTLWTDAGAARGTELIELMEHLHQVVWGIAFPERSSAGRSFAIALRDSVEVHAYLHPSFSAVAFVGDNALNQPAILFAADTDEHTITHELTHLISDVAIKRQPHWFAEGIAQFFETVNLDTDNATVDVGAPSPKMITMARRLQLMPGDEFFPCKQTECLDGRYYLTAALLFAYLANTRPQQLLALEDRLAVQDPQALQHAVPDLTPESLDRTLRAWETSGQHRLFKFKVQLARQTMKQRTVSDAEVLAARAFLLLENKGDTDETRAAIAAARAADPTNLMAVLVENQQLSNARRKDPRHEIRIPIELARTMTKLHPDDWRSWMLVLDADSQGAEVKVARAHVCTLVVKNPANYINGFCPSSMLHPHDVVPGGGEGSDQPVSPEQVP